MDRWVFLLLGGVVVALVVAVTVTSLGATTPEVRPVDIVDGNEEYDGDRVTLKGRLETISDRGSDTTFVVAGPNASVTVTYDGSLPVTFEVGRHVIVEGTADDGRVRASTVKVQAHLEGDRPSNASRANHPSNASGNNQSWAASRGDQPPITA
jgi:cytochrome c-type biogenesis protein CcmE